MKNTKKIVLQIIGIFIVFMTLCAILIKLTGNKEKAVTTAENISDVENISEYDIAKSDFEKNGMKAMWISYIDYKLCDFSSEESFKQSIEKMFKECKDIGLNTVIVHARSFGDAYYKSDIFPYSHIITGTQGKDPGYDPLKIMVDAAHRIGLRIEAWVNPYRVQANGTPNVLSEANPAVTNPELTSIVGEDIYYNPALQQARDLITDGVVEIVKNYDIDGIHFDDYFYPTTDENFDKKEFLEYQGTLSLDEWRRENVNILVKQVYKAIKDIKEDVVFGISPQGNNDNNYQMQYSDVCLWLNNEGYVDYIMPQVYWGFDYETKSGSDRFSFGKIVDEWDSYTKNEKVKLYMGLGAYRIGKGDGSYKESSEWQSGKNIAKMISNLKEKNIDGYAIYAYNSLYGNTEYQDLQSREKNEIYIENNK